MKEEEEKTCFVIMPISDIDEYNEGHFKRVYEYIIKPACLAAGFVPVRADDVKKTNVIVIDILQRLINSDMAICDLSAKNPNVLYELGIRQAFDLPVTFIKDDITSRIFDIQGFRDIEYKSTLRIDEVNSAVEEITISLKDTYESKSDDVNSIIQLLSIAKAKVPEKLELSPETEIVLKSLHDLSSRLGIIEENLSAPPRNLRNYISNNSELDSHFKTLGYPFLKACKEVNIGLSTAADFLTKRGFYIDPKPNFKLSEEMYQTLIKEFKTLQQ